MDETRTGLNLRFKIDEESMGYAINATQHTNGDIITFSVENPRIRGKKIDISGFRKMFKDKHPFDIEVYTDKEKVKEYKKCYCVGLGFGVAPKYPMSHEYREVINMKFAKSNRGKAK